MQSFGVKQAQSLLHYLLGVTGSSSGCISQFGRHLIGRTIRLTCGGGSVLDAETPWFFAFRHNIQQYGFGTTTY